MVTYLLLCAFPIAFFLHTLYRPAASFDHIRLHCIFIIKKKLLTETIESIFSGTNIILAAKISCQYYFITILSYHKLIVKTQTVSLFLNVFSKGLGPYYNLFYHSKPNL